MGLALIKGLGLGAGLMYFLDPDLGQAAGDGHRPVRPRRAFI